MTLIKIALIRRDGGTQTRTELNQAKVNEYAEARRNGDVFPAITVFYDGSAYWNADGFHRLAAEEQIGHDEIDANIRQGTQRDAILYSVGANAKHGLARTDDDKRRAVETLLLDPEWAQWSDREIARRAGVSNSMVSEWRHKLAESHPTVAHLQSTLRKGADGRVIETANIGLTDDAGEVETAPERAEPPAHQSHWSEASGGYFADRFWDEVDKYRLDRAAVLNLLQAGAVTLADLEMNREQAEEALRHLGSAALQRLYPKGTPVVRISKGWVGHVKDYGPDRLEVNDSHPNHYDRYWSAGDVRMASPDEIAAYQRIVGEYKAARKTTGEQPGRIVELRLASSDPLYAPDHVRGWRERYDAMRDRIPAEAIEAAAKRGKPLLLALMTPEGYLILGEGAKALNPNAYELDGTPAVAAVSTEWRLRENLPGYDVYHYDDRSFEARRAHYQVMKRGKARLLPGDLVVTKQSGIQGVITRISGGDFHLDQATFDEGVYESLSYTVTQLDLVQAWVPGEPRLKPALRPALALPPRPWTYTRAINDAKGQQLSPNIYGGSAEQHHYMRRTVEIVNCPASAYTGDKALAGSLDRLLGALGAHRVYNDGVHSMHADMQTALAYLAPWAVQLGFEFSWLPPLAMRTEFTPPDPLLDEFGDVQLALPITDPIAAAPTAPVDKSDEKPGVLKPADAPFERGDWVQTTSGHFGMVLYEQGNAVTVETVNGRRPYKRDHLLHRRTIRFQSGDEVRHILTLNVGRFVRLQDDTIAVCEHNGTEYITAVYELELIRRAISQPVGEPI